MKLRNVVFTLLAAMLVSGCGRGNMPPHAPVNIVTEKYHGLVVTDPYRYMENMDDTVFLDWMKQYADHTRKVLDAIPGREGLIDMMKDFDGRQSDRIYSLKITEGGRYFYMKITPEDETGKLYFRDGYQGKEKLLYDPADFRPEDLMSYVISGFYPSIEGEKVGISLSPNGSESNTVIVKEVGSGRIFGDKVELVMGGCSWLPGGKGFIYHKINSRDIHDPNRFINTKVCYHSIGTGSSEDRVIFSSALAPEVRKRPEELPFIFYDHHADQLILMLYTVERYIKMYIAAGNPISRSAFDWRPVILASDQVQGYYIMDDALYLYTAKGASNFKILKTTLSDPDIPGAETIVPEPAGAMISGFAFSRDALYYTMKINGVQEVLFRLPYGADAPEQVDLPAAAGSLKIQTRGHRFDDVWVTVTGWTLDRKRYRYLAGEDRFLPEPLSAGAEYPEFNDLLVEELMIESHDGTQVPLSLVYREGTPLNGTAPLIMTGYGAYGVSLSPSFQPYRLIWTLKGGIYAVAHVRGGGELGDAWRLAGHKTSKPNTWKDFIACAEYLVEQNYTSPDHLAVFGGSAGGILIGRSMTERPDLFAAAVPLVGAMNTLRLEESPNGPVNTPEFGTVKDSAECMALLEMDAYHHIEDGTDYPATLITAGFNDPRVIVWQPAKFAARLQAANGSRNPVLFDVDYSSGHGAGDTKSKSFADMADLYAFALWRTGHGEFQPE